MNDIAPATCPHGAKLTADAYVDVYADGCRTTDSVGSGPARVFWTGPYLGEGHAVTRPEVDMAHDEALAEAVTRVDRSGYVTLPNLMDALVSLAKEQGVPTNDELWDILSPANDGGLIGGVPEHVRYAETKGWIKGDAIYDGYEDVHGWVITDKGQKAYDALIELDN